MPNCNCNMIYAALAGNSKKQRTKSLCGNKRFMNTSRVSLSDIDTDFPPSRIDDVKKYIYSKTGLYCCDIVTFNTIALKGAIRDVGRALEIPLKTVSEICDTVESKGDNLRKKYPELFKYVDLVIGTIVSVGSHPCGCVVSPHSVTDRLGTFTTSTSEYPISQIYMKEIDGLNYVKLDLLRLDTIELINETCKLANIERLTPDNVDIDDIKVWNSMRDDTTQIFQWEGDMGGSYIKRLLSDENIAKFQQINKNVDRMTLLSIGNSAIRPAGASYRDDLANGVIRKSGSAAIDEFLKPTFGYLVFQCQIIEFLHQYCGFTMGEADIVRRHFAKKTGTETDIPIIKDGGYMKNGNKDSSHYIKGFVATMSEKYGMAKDESEKAITAFLQVIIDASNYLFSLNHSQPYSYEGYVSAWLRYYYPVEFITVALNINAGKEEKTIGLTNYAKSKGMLIKPPRFRHSKSEYLCDNKNKCIYKGIGSIKYLNSSAANELYSLRNNEYKDFMSLLKDISKTSVNSRQLEILIKIDFFEEFGDISCLLSCNEIFQNYVSKRQIKKEKALQDGLSFDMLRNISGKETPKSFMEIDSDALLEQLAQNIPLAKTKITTKIQYQLDALGYIDIVDKKYAGYCYVNDVDTKYSPKLTLYAMANGGTIKVKIDKKTYSKKPVEKGDIIKVVDCYKKPKVHKDGDRWVESSEKEWWITEYKIV